MQQAFRGGIESGEGKKGQNSGGSLGDSQALVDSVMNFRITVVNRARFQGRWACLDAPSVLRSSHAPSDLVE
jgi:hypothetical protein